MDLRSGYPYYFLKNGFYRNLDILRSDHSAEVVIIGGGISGALAAYYLLKEGIKSTVLDKRSVGTGSTAASTSLLQYELDVPLHQLVEKIGRENAFDAYKRCAAAIDDLQKIAVDIGFKGFESCNSLYFAHRDSVKEFMKREFECRQQARFDVKLLSATEINEIYGIKSEAAIVSGKAAKLDPFAFTKSLYDHLIPRGVRVFENTRVVKIKYAKDGAELITDKNYRVNCSAVIHATGYESVSDIGKDLVELKSTYACVSERIPGLPRFFKDTVMWNTADPYLYIREDDERIIIGGRDDDFYDPGRRDKRLEKRTMQLKNDFCKLFPGVDYTIRFPWAGTFASTKDGLPYIGTKEEMPRAYYALGFGGNGITFSVIAGELIALSVSQGKNHIPSLFSFNRKTK